MNKKIFEICEKIYTEFIKILKIVSGYYDVSEFCDIFYESLVC